MKLFVTAVATLALTAIAAQGKYIKKRVPLTSPPGQVAVGYKDRFERKFIVYVANGDKVSVFDAEDESFVEDILVPHAHALAYDRTLRLLYLSAVQDGQTQVWIRSSAGGVIETPITSTPGDGITAMAVDPWIHRSGGRVYIANASDQRVDILRSTGVLLKSIAMPAKPTGIAIGGRARLAFVSLANGDLVSIGLSTLKVSTIQAGNSLGGVVVDPYGSQRVFALDTDAVEGLDPHATSVRRSFAVPRGSVAGAAASDKFHQIFITGPNGTLVFNALTYQVIHTFPNSGGTSLAIVPTKDNKIYVPSSTANQLIVIGGTD